MQPRKEFDYTALSTFANCRQKYHYRINRGLVGLEPMLAPEFGGAIHKALDVMYAWKMEHGTFATEDGIKIFKAEYEEDLEKDDKRTHQMGEWILRNYAQTYQDEPFHVIASEQAFTLPLPNGNNFIGRIDKIIEWAGVHWVLDHKTTSQLGSQYSKSLEPNAQYTGYVWAAQQLGYKKCAGVIVDAILVAKGLLQASSRARLTPLARFDAYRSQGHIDEWMVTTIKLHKDIRHQEDHDIWPMDGTFNGLCTYYGECPYRRLCREEPGVREQIIKTDYKVEFWDPREDD